MNYPKRKEPPSMDYYIKLKNTQIPVTEEIYKAYCQGARKERYFRESDIHNQTFFYDALDTEELNGSDMFSDPAAESVEDAVQKHILLEKLKEIIGRLPKEEQHLLSRLYVYGDSLRQLSRTLDIPVTTLQARHQRLLKKLKKNLEN
jgi:DNA-directed RNA polymerase specialized sigma subunit, sigma24 homolog